jgi:hypothetical protein
MNTIIQGPYFNRQLPFVTSAATAPRMWAESCINKTNEPTESGNLQLSHNIKNKQLSSELPRHTNLTITAIELTKLDQYQISLKLVCFKPDGPEIMTII